MPIDPTGPQPRVKRKTHIATRRVTTPKIDPQNPPTIHDIITAKVGKPVVSTNCSAIPEILDHDKGGFLCEVDSVDQMVAAIRNLGHSFELRQEMGNYNRRAVLGRFTLEHMSNRYGELFRGLLA